MIKILTFLKNHKWLTFLSIFCTISVVFIDLYNTQLMANIVDNGIPNANFQYIVSTGLLMTGLAILNFFLGAGSTSFSSLVSNKVAFEVRETIFKKIQRFSLKKTSKYTTGSLVTRLSTDIDFIQRTLNFALRLLVRSPIMLASAVIVVWNTEQRMAYIVLALVVFLLFVMGLIIIYGFPRFRKVQQKLDSLNQNVQEGLINIRLIKSFVREDYEDHKFRITSEDLKGKSIQAQRIFLFLDPVMMLCLNLATLAIMLLGSYFAVFSQTLRLGDLLVFLNYMRFTLFSMMMITMIFSMISRSKASTDRLKEIMDEEIDITSPRDVSALSDIKGHVQFNDVSFKYYLDNEQYILKDINFEVLPGEQLGIIGSTGSGKSTLVNLLVRLIDPIDGEITIDGVNINQLDLKKLREMIGFVPQKSVLFTGSYLDNLRWGNADATRDDVILATKIASIYDFIKGNPDGVDGMITQGGTNLSGGQRQRFSIARALVKKPQILVLDDSTSALDQATEAQINETFQNELKDTTIINIAQKISSISHCDKIIVLEKGEMVGYGTHQSLLESNAIYQEIYESQMRKEVI